MREPWVVGQCVCGRWIGFPVPTEVYRFDERIFLGVCVCGEAYSVTLGVHRGDHRPGGEAPNPPG